MNREKIAAQFKKRFYDKLEKTGMTVDEFTRTPEGVALLKCANAATRLLEEYASSRQKQANIMKAVREQPLLSTLAALGAGGVLGVGGGAGLSAMTGPSNVEVSNLQKKELAAEYADAITRLKDRMALNELRRT